MIFAPQIKIIAALTAISAGLGYALYWQIGKTAETKAALKVFQAELAAQVEENQRVSKLLIEREKQAQATRTATQKQRAKVNEAIAAKPAQDCVNTAIPDDLRVLLN